MPKSQIEINIINSSPISFLPKKKVHTVIERILLDHKKKNGTINIIYTSDDYLRNLNKQFLNHDYNTDVLSFQLDEEGSLDGEVYISSETAVMQAQEYKVSLSNEILRLAIHGTLHILGYDDAEIEAKQKMTELENKYISRN
ncbi:MAG: rRNA maturation RNase YbeY [Candidatus Kapabacteria bacterium]|nr:rRNA maturation RNase YbeY [Candidatus Kapabacteria bacterium]